MRRFLRWLWARTRWLWAVAKILLVVLWPLAPVFVATRTEHWRVCLLVGGLAVQLAGFVTVWVQIRQALKSHGRPSVLSRIVTWWKSRRGVVLAATGSSISISGSEAQMRVRKDKGDGSANARLDALERNLGHLEAEFDASSVATSKKLSELKSALAEETRRRTEAGEALSRRIEDTAVGSADWQLIGLTWFVAGSILSAISGWPVPM